MSTNISNCRPWQHGRCRSIPPNSHQRPKTKGRLAKKSEFAFSRYSLSREKKILAIFCGFATDQTLYLFQARSNRQFESILRSFGDLRELKPFYALAAYSRGDNVTVITGEEAVVA